MRKLFLTGLLLSSANVFAFGGADVLLNNVSDDRRREYEAKFLKEFVEENGLLPPHNRIMGVQH